MTPLNALKTPDFPDIRINLNALQDRLIAQLAWAFIIFSGLLFWFTLPTQRLPAPVYGLLAGLAGVGLAARWLTQSNPRLARHLFVWGLLLALAAGMWVLNNQWLPFFLLFLVFISATLVPRSELVVTAVILALAAWMVVNDYRAYPLPELSMVAGLGLVLAWLILQTMATALQWTWHAYQRVGDLLQETRSHRAELSQALRSLEQAHYLQQRTQRELIAARRQAEEARQMKEQFAANISHELRTPLNLILGFSEIMYWSPEVYGLQQFPPTLLRDINHIYRSSQHLLEMINDILELSHLGIAEFTLRKEPTDMNALLTDTVEIAANLLRGHPARLETEIPPDLPVLAIDQTRIRQVLLNLLNNARRHTEAGAIRLRVWTDADHLHVAVADTGSGIPADKLPYVFDAFYQAAPSLRRSQGAGLGLAISKRFVEAHKGSIKAASEEGVGSTFTFSLPLAPHRPLPTAGETAVSPTPDAQLPILVVDPDPAVAALVQRHLPDVRAIPVATTADLPEAIRYHHPHAVVLNTPTDEEPPPLPPDLPPTPIFCCTLPGHGETAVSAAATATLSKPVTRQALWDAIGQMPEGIERVLIVDDDRAFCLLVQQMLQSGERPSGGRSFAVKRAYGGQEGLDAMRTWRPDLVILDLAMPEMDGTAVLQAMQQDPDLAHLSVLLLTGLPPAADTAAQRSSRFLLEFRRQLTPAAVLACLEATLNIVEPDHSLAFLADGNDDDDQPAG